MIEWIFLPEAWLALLTLTALEIVLGIDNIIFITILVGRLPREQRDKARIIGLSLAMGSRILLLLGLAWIMQLTRPLFEIWGMPFSGRDIILILGGLFLIAKSTHEIHNALEGKDLEDSNQVVQASFTAVLVQIAIIDIIFSLDSVITAVGMAKHLPVMIIAIIIAVLVMMFSAKTIGDFVDEHPTFKMLALSFLILVGVALLGEGFELHIPKGYIYFAMFYSFSVEMLNTHMRKRSKRKVKLHKHIPLSEKNQP